MHVDISVSPAAERKVTVQFRRKGVVGWTDSMPVTTTPAGQARVNFTPPETGTWQVRLKVAASSSAAAATSAIRTVTCSGAAARTKLTGWSTTEVQVGSGQAVSWPVTVSGGGARQVQVEARAPGAEQYRVVQSAVTSREGKIAVSFTGDVVGAWSIRLRIEASATARALTSAPRKVMVQAGKAAPVTEVCGEISTDTTWLPATTTVYHITCDLIVGQGATLTVPAGAVVKSGHGVQLRVTSGSLVVSGTQASPVVFTSWFDDAFGGDSDGDEGSTVPAAGFWMGIRVTDGGSVALAWARVRYADFAPGMLYVSDGKSATVTDSVFEGFGCGTAVSIDMFRPMEYPRVQRNTFRDIACVGRDGEPRDFGSVLDVSGNLDVGLLGGNASERSPAGIRLRGSISVSGILDSPASFPVGFFLTFVEPGVTLTVPAGSVVKSGVDFVGSTSLGISGSLVVAGTQASPVVFTSRLDDAFGGDSNGDGSTTIPAMGDWAGILVGPGGSASLANVDLRYADTGLEVGFPNPGPEDLGAEASISGAFRFVRVGVRTYGLGLVDARNVDWGDPTGPAPIGKGAAVVGDGVAVYPWVGMEPPKEPEPPPSQAPPPVSGCKDVRFIGARGSDEPPRGSDPYQDMQDGMGTPVWSVFDAWTKYLNDTRPNVRTEGIGLRYPALKVPDFPFGWLNVIYNIAFVASVQEGVWRLQEYLDAFSAACPDQKYVLAGYSQGALAIHLYLNRVAPTGIKSKIAAVVLIADPAKFPGSGESTFTNGMQPADEWNLLTSGIWTWGTAAYPVGYLWKPGPLPDWITPRTFALCYEKDMICRGPGLGNTFEDRIHGAYGRNTSDMTALGERAALTTTSYLSQTPVN